MQQKLFLSIFLAAAILLAGCAKSSSHNPPIPSSNPLESTNVGNSETQPSPTPTLAASLISDPSVRFTVITKDQNGLGPNGIPIRVTGALNQMLATDAKGIANLTGPAGRYAFAIPTGCQDSFLIRYGGTATRGVPPGIKMDVGLSVQWEHRIAPSASSDASEGPYWRVGNTIKVRFVVIDRCEEKLAPPGSRFPSWRFRVNSLLEVVSPPELLVDGNSRSEIQVRCKTEGQPSLVAYDSENLPDEVDLMAHVLNGPTTGPVECRN